MNIEYEVRILDINQDLFEKKLKELGAIFIDHYFQRRYVYDMKPKKDGKWIRLRTNGKNTTIAIKDITKDAVDGTKELEIEVDDFEKAKLLLEELGYHHKGSQENKRTRYILDDVEIDIDTWPGIATYVEIEGKNEEEIHKIVEKLGYNMDDTVTMDIEKIYFHYGYQKQDLNLLKFEEEEI